MTSLMSKRRFDQIGHFVHISDDKLPFSPASWWQKLEPTSSYIQLVSQQYYHPSTNVSVDEMMVRFFGRGQLTIKAPHKPIKQGYKILALCNHGYTVPSHGSIHREHKVLRVLLDFPNLSATSSAVQLCQPLPSKIHQFHLYMDNHFTNIPLLHTYIAPCISEHAEHYE